MRRASGPARLLAGSLLAALLEGCFATCPAHATRDCLEIGDIRGAAGRGELARLARWLRDDRSWVREEAARSLGAARVAHTAPALEALSLDEQEKRWVRAAAVEALGEIGAPGSVPVLVGLAERRGLAPEIQLAVIDALCRYVPPRGPEVRGGPGPEELSALQAVAGLRRHEDLLVAAAAEKRARGGCAR